jgi:hypothetical protein
MMSEYIAVAFSFVGGNRSRTLGCLSKRKWWRMGPRRPKGRMVNVRSAILLLYMSPMMLLLWVMMLVLGLCWFTRLSFHHS